MHWLLENDKAVGLFQLIDHKLRRVHQCLTAASDSDSYLCLREVLDGAFLHASHPDLADTTAIGRTPSSLLCSGVTEAEHSQGTMAAGAAPEASSFTVCVNTVDRL